MTASFIYPPVAHVRRHGPGGYADYASYRPWLRDEFSFRCVYCLLREQWGRVRGVYDIDHFLAVVIDAAAALDYENLLYACATCNAVKGKRRLPNPLTVLTSANVYVSEDGVLHARSAEAARLVERLGLNSDQSVEFRLLWIGIVALAAKRNPELYRRLMGFPKDLPDLHKLKPPGGNSRPEGVAASFCSRKQRGELPDTY